MGPHEDSSPMCLSCYTSVDLSYLCNGCEYPMCDSACAASEGHKVECQVLSKGPSPSFECGDTGAYHCILPLRLLLLARSDPELFSLTERFMDHDEERREGKRWMTTERTVVNHVLEECKGEQIEGFTKEKIRWAIGILEINSFVVQASMTSGFKSMFALASLQSHNCRSNSTNIWGEKPPYTNTCIAAVDIKEGDEIFIRYQMSTKAAIRRRQKLKQGW